MTQQVFDLTRKGEHMAKKKKKALSSASKKGTSKKKPTAPRKRSIKKKPTQAKKKSRGAKKGSSEMRLTWDLATLLEDGLPSDGTRSDAYHFVLDEGVSLTWICEVLSEAIGRVVVEKQVKSVLSRNEVPMLTLYPGDDGSSSGFANMPMSDYRTLIQQFRFEGSPKKVNYEKDTFVHPRGLGVLESVPDYAAVRNHGEWRRLKKHRSV